MNFVDNGQRGIKMAALLIQTSFVLREWHVIRHLARNSATQIVTALCIGRAHVN